LDKFANVAFKNLDGGISVIDDECVTESGTELCTHLIEFYSVLDAPPHIMWRFDSSILGSQVTLIPEESVTGDKCHFNIVGLTNSQAKKIFKNFDPLRDGEICDNSCPRRLIPSDMATIVSFGSPSH
jgi:hypothetical protein